MGDEKNKDMRNTFPGDEELMKVGDVRCVIANIMDEQAQKIAAQREDDLLFLRELHDQYKKRDEQWAKFRKSAIGIITYAIGAVLVKLLLLGGALGAAIIAHAMQHGDKIK